jgi:hypothetical protein
VRAATQTAAGTPTPDGAKPPGPATGGRAGPRKAGETVEVEIARAVKMTFCWVPPGTADLGSLAEEEYVTRTWYAGRRPDILDRETHDRRGTFKSAGFWLGKYPVTQGEYLAVTGRAPSAFGPAHPEVEKARITNARRFPVESVSWDEAAAFTKRVNAIGKRPTPLGRGTFGLPHEDDWEYACRGGAQAGVLLRQPAGRRAGQRGRPAPVRVSGQRPDAQPADGGRGVRNGRLPPARHRVRPQSDSHGPGRPGCRQRGPIGAAGRHESQRPANSSSIRAVRSGGRPAKMGSSRAAKAATSSSAIHVRAGAAGSPSDRRAIISSA